MAETEKKKCDNPNCTCVDCTCENCTCGQDNTATSK